MTLPAGSDSAIFRPTPHEGQASFLVNVIDHPEPKIKMQMISSMKREVSAPASPRGANAL